MTVYTAISLFSGVGGIDWAFAEAGFDIIAQVEIDEFCRKVLAKHGPRYWPHAKQYVDIRNVIGADIGYADAIFGGFPCQDISIAGEGAGLAGERSGLWYEFSRLIGEIRPRFALLENVPAITTRGGLAVLASLTALGYDAEWQIVSAAEAGAPHKRERWYCMAYTRRFGRQEPHGSKASRHLGKWVGEARLHREGDVGAVVGGREVLGDTLRAGLEGRKELGRTPGEAQLRPAQRTGLRRRQREQHRMAQSSVGRDDARLSPGLDEHRWPAGQGSGQYDYEPPREVASNEKDRAARIKALGNAVIPQNVYPFALDIARRLSEGE
jgi:DNA (cytosine-5)-methyltransferase 1